MSVGEEEETVGGKKGDGTRGRRSERVAVQCEGEGERLGRGAKARDEIEKPVGLMNIVGYSSNSHVRRKDEKQKYPTLSSFSPFLSFFSHLSVLSSPVMDSSLIITMPFFRYLGTLSRPSEGPWIGNTGMKADEGIHQL